MSNTVTFWRSWGLGFQQINLGGDHRIQPATGSFPQTLPQLFLGDYGQASRDVPTWMCSAIFLANIPRHHTPVLSWRGGQLSTVLSR